MWYNAVNVRVKFVIFPLKKPQTVQIRAVLKLNVGLACQQHAHKCTKTEESISTGQLKTEQVQRAAGFVIFRKISLDKSSVPVVVCLLAFLAYVESSVWYFVFHSMMHATKAHFFP